MFVFYVLYYSRIERFRSSLSEVFCLKGVLRNFAKFTGKHLCQSLFFNKVAGLRPVTLLKKRLWHRCFPVNFVKFLRTPFFIEHRWWLLLGVKTWALSSACKAERADFADWVSFLSSILKEKISPNTEALSENT